MAFFCVPIIFGIHTFPHSHIILEKGAYTDMRVVGVAQQPMVRSRLLVVLMAIFQKVACFQPIQVRTSNNFAVATPFWLGGCCRDRAVFGRRV